MWNVFLVNWNRFWKFELYEEIKEKNCLFFLLFLKVKLPKELLTLYWFLVTISFRYFLENFLIFLIKFCQCWRFLQLYKFFSSGKTVCFKVVFRVSGMKRNVLLRIILILTPSIYFLSLWIIISRNGNCFSLAFIVNCIAEKIEFKISSNKVGFIFSAFKKKKKKKKNSQSSRYCF